MVIPSGTENHNFRVIKMWKSWCDKQRQWAWKSNWKEEVWIDFFSSLQVEAEELTFLGQGHFEGQGLEGVLQDGRHEGKTKINEISGFTVTIYPHTASIAQYAISKRLLNAGNGEWTMIAGWNRDLIKRFTNGNYMLHVVSQYKTT